MRNLIKILMVIIIACLFCLISMAIFAENAYAADSSETELFSDQNQSYIAPGDSRATLGHESREIMQLRLQLQQIKTTLALTTPQQQVAWQNYENAIIADASTLRDDAIKEKLAIQDKYRYNAPSISPRTRSDPNNHTGSKQRIESAKENLYKTLTYDQQQVADQLLN